MTRNRWLLILAGTLVLGPLRLPAQGDEPGKGVARISLIHGDVSVRRGDSGDWVAAAINAPLLAEDRVLTGPASRAEVQFDFYHRIRLAADSEIRLTQLESRLYQIQVVRGVTTFSALKGGDAQVEINTPAAALRPVAWGEYRVTVFDDDRAELTVRRGEAEIFTPSGSQRLRPGRSLIVRLTPDNRAEYQYVAEIPHDAWDDFNRNRDRELSRSADVYRYVSRDIYGAEDLYGHGHWVHIAPYGWCWQPVVAAGWAPYRFGRWVWLDWYGWTWVSYDPWGWAPYHYGRWFWANNAWFWYPGAVIGVRHWWSPALVGWFGWSSWGGFTAGVGFGWGAVGWVPLAPFEPLYPWWGRRFAGYRSVNYVYQNTTIIQNTNITNLYRNARIRDGVTVVRGDDFVRGHAGRPLRLGGEELSRASLARGAVPFAPARESLRLADREPTLRRTATDNARADRFYTRRPVERAERIPFDEQRRTFEQWTSRGSGAEGRREAAEGFRGAQRSTPRADAQDNRGWRPAAPRNNDDGARTTFRNSEGDRSPSGWRRVEEPAARTESRSGESNWRRFGDPGVGARNEERVRTRPETQSGDAGRIDSGWRSFGDPSRTAPRSESPRWSTGGARSDDGVRVSPAPRAESPRWSTGGARGDNGGARPAPAPRSETPRAEPRAEPSRGGEGRSSPRGERGNSFAPMSRGAWSTGGFPAAGSSSFGRGSDPAGAASWRGSRAESSGGTVVDLSPRSAPRSESPRWSTGSVRGDDGGARPAPTPRSETPRAEPRADPSQGGEGRSSPRGERGNSFAPMSRGAWSTGGFPAAGSSSFGRGSDPAGAASWRGSRAESSGGTVVDLSPRSAPRSESPRWSTGVAGSRAGWAGDGFSVPRSAPSYGGSISVPRSAPSFGGSIAGPRSESGYRGSIGPSPSFGGGGIRGGSIGSSPSFGGGGIRGGSIGSSPSFGGGGIRGGMGGGAVRSAPSGSGSRGGRGR